MRNRYCSNCLRTERFLDLGGFLVCQRCSKRLERLNTTEFAALLAQPRPTEPWHSQNWPADFGPMWIGKYDPLPKSDCASQLPQTPPARRVVVAKPLAATPPSAANPTFTPPAHRTSASNTPPVLPSNTQSKPKKSPGGIYIP